MDLSEQHVASLPMRIRALLARAEGETGLPQLVTLAAASQMLRELLDAVDRRLHNRLDRARDTDRLVARDEPTPADLLATLTHVAAHLDQDDPGPLLQQ